MPEAETSAADRPRIWTIADVLRWTTGRLSGVSDSPRLDAEVLLAHCLSCERITLYVDYAKPLAPAELSGYRDAVRRRIGGEPVARITGQREFWSLSFAVDERVLVPRPETELLVEQALAWLRQRPEVCTRAIDVGCGSGAIAVALGHELPRLELVLADLSLGALTVARQNAARHGVAARFVLADLLAPFAAHSFDLVLANLPYVTGDEIERLEPEVARYDPRIALDGGVDGLALLRRLVGQVGSRLRPGGLVLLEIGATQGAAVVELLRGEHLDEVEVLKDLAGLDRAVRARRRA